MHRLLVLYIGCGSQRCSLFELPDGALPEAPLDPVWEAKLDISAPHQSEEQIAIQLRRHDIDLAAGVIPRTSSVETRTQTLLRLLVDDRFGILSRPDQVELVAHRVVHGGAEFAEATLITPEVEAQIERLAAFAPLHNPSNLIGIRVARDFFGSAVPQAAVFDTAFHRTLPEAAATYAVPYEWRQQGIRRYGCHGTSFKWASSRATQLLNRPDASELRLIICHLGAGCSLCATVGGRSIDTTTGFTPLDGVAMCTRSGSIDPSIVLYQLRQGMSADEIESVLNTESGLQGLSGLEGDTRLILPRADSGNARAKLAINVFIHRLRAGMGQMLASLGQVPDAIVFTDAISEDEPRVRETACSAFAYLGLSLDVKKNCASPLDTDIATPQSTVRALLIKSREAWQIARECRVLLENHPSGHSLRRDSGPALAPTETLARPIQ